MPYPYQSICVFCASADNLDLTYYNAAREMGRLLAQQKVKLVYGAGRTGLMGAVAEGALQEGGEVIGIVPKGLESPQLIYTTGLTKLEIVPDIQQRNQHAADQRRRDPADDQAENDRQCRLDQRLHPLDRFAHFAVVEIAHVEQ